MDKTLHFLIMYTMLVLTLLLFHKGRKHHRSLMLGIYAAVEVITNGLNGLTLSSGWGFFDKYPFSHYIYKPLYCLWVPLFYFYVRSCFSPDYKWKKKQLLHLIPFVVFLIYFLLVWTIKGNHFIWENLYNEESFFYASVYAVDAFVKLQYLFYNYLMIRLLIRSEQNLKQKDLIRKPEVDIRWLRFIVYGYALGCIGGIALFISKFISAELAGNVNIASMSYFFMFFFAIFYDTITHKPYEQETKHKLTPVAEADMVMIAEKVKQMVKDQKKYLDPELSLQQIATEINEKERNISQAINTVKGRNIKDYINFYRVENACELLLTDKEKPIFEIMYESGFNTKGAFNLAFKKQTGMTPTEYREKAAQN